MLSAHKKKQAHYRRQFSYSLWQCSNETGAKGGQISYFISCKA